MKFTKTAFKKAAKAQQVDPKQLLAKVEDLLQCELDARDAEDKPQQYDILKDVINAKEVLALKEYFGITEFTSPHEMRWMLINVFNAED